MGFLQDWFIARLIPHDVTREVYRHECPGRNHLPVVVRDRLDLDVDTHILIVRGREWRPGQIVVRGPPGDPGWTPTAAWHPEPAGASAQRWEPGLGFTRGLAGDKSGRQDRRC